MLDYDVIDSLLARVEAEAYAAEFHGFISGQLCVTGSANEELWKDFLDIQSNDEELIRLCHEEMLQLINVTSEQLQSDDFGLQLLLPDDDASMGLRAEALVNWCHGFLNGFGLSEGRNQNGVSAEVNEVIEDFTQICRLDLDEDEEDEEQTFMELQEYVRMGTILVYEELQPAMSRPEDLH